jgi:RecA-family ATPase
MSNDDRSDKNHPKSEVLNFANKHNIPILLPIDIEIEKLSQVKMKRIDWIWKDVIARGKLTLFAGEPGVGKSQLLLYIASIISNGNKFHFEPKNCEQQKVLLISGEDESEDTIVPRLKALGANIDNIDNVKGIKKIDKNGQPYYDVICLVQHLAELEKKIIENNYKILIVDPITIYLGSIDQHKNNEIRSALGVITALAERHDLGLILNSHFSKPSGASSKNAIYRVMGSIGFAAAARIVYGIMKDPENPEKRLFLPIKNNIGQDKYGFVYKIESVFLENGIETSCIKWIDEKIDKTANEILNAPTEVKAPKLEEVKQFLIDLLKNGSVSLSLIRKECIDRGYSIDRMYKAKDDLKINEESSFGGKRGKIWMLSPLSPTNRQTDSC